MAHVRGRRHQYTIDGQTIWLDSLNEEYALMRLINWYGFSGRWARHTGIKHAGKLYTPDFELSIQDGNGTSRALLEVKQYKKDFGKNMSKRFRVIARHYHTKYLFLYVVSSDSWYRIIIKNGYLQRCKAPLPGKLLMSEIRSPKSFIVKSPYGRRYSQSYADYFLSTLKKII